MAAFADRIQALMDEVYSEWQTEENKGKDKWDVLKNFSQAHQIAVMFGNFNHQVENGGLSQWIYNGYFYDDAEELTNHLEANAGLDERFQAILDRIYSLERYAMETECDRYGDFRDEEGDSGFIGDAIDCDKFDTWYYAHCGNESWWEAVCGIIDRVEALDKTEAHDLPPVSQDELAVSAEAPTITDTPPASEGTHVHPSINVYIENATKPEIGGFTIPLPFTKEGLAPWMAAIEADTNNPDSIRVEVGSSVIAPILEAVGLPLDELNYLAAKVNALQPYELEMFLAAINTGDYGANLTTLINLTENIGKFELQPAFDAVEYGDFLLQCAKDSGADAFEKLEQSAAVDERYFASHIQRMEDLVNPADYAHVVIAEEKGQFTEYGYLRLCGTFEEVYHGPEDIPVEHRLLATQDIPPVQAMIDAPCTQPEKESVMDKIRRAKAAKTEPLAERQPLLPGQSEAER